MEATAKIVEAVRAMLVPELQQVTSRMDRIDGRLEEISKRFDDVNARFNDLSRNVDARFDDLNRNVDARFNDVNRRIDELTRGQQTIIQCLNHTNQRVDHLYDVVVKQEDYHKLEFRVIHLEEEVSGLKLQAVG